MDRVRKLLEAKGGEIWSVAPDDSVFTAIESMATHECGALAVMEGGALVGIISERDYARKVILAGRSSKSTTVREIMTAEVVTAGLDDKVEDCLRLMTERRIRHLPVMQGERVVGMISIGDLVKAIIAQQRFLISQLEQYIKQ